MKKELTRIAREAGTFFLDRQLTSVTHKEGHANFVTNIDCRVEAYLEEALSRLLPGSRLIGEEKENQALTDAPTWIVDPLDGTTNMIHDYRMSSVSIALCENRRPTVGLVWQPYTGEMFYAEGGKGAELNGQPIHVSRTLFQDALVAVGTSPYYEELEECSMNTARAFLHACADIRRCGSAAVDLACVACGRIDVFFEMRLKPWDYAAGSLLVKEAGGAFCMPMAGEVLNYDLATGILAAAPSCMEQALEIYRRYQPSPKA